MTNDKETSKSKRIVGYVVASLGILLGVIGMVWGVIGFLSN